MLFKCPQNNHSEKECSLQRHSKLISYFLPDERCVFGLFRMGNRKIVWNCLIKWNSFVSSYFFLWYTYCFVKLYLTYWGYEESCPNFLVWWGNWLQICWINLRHFKASTFTHTKNEQNERSLRHVEENKVSHTIYLLMTVVHIGHHSQYNAIHNSSSATYSIVRE